jgi:hypothetical protein
VLSDYAPLGHSIFCYTRILLSLGHMPRTDEPTPQRRQMGGPLVLSVLMGYFRTTGGESVATYILSATYLG